MSLSDKIWCNDSNEELVYTEHIKKFIKKQLDNISNEQKISKGRDWQRSLVKLKAELETDAGEELI